MSSPTVRHHAPPVIRGRSSSPAAASEVSAGCAGSAGRLRLRFHLAGLAWLFHVKPAAVSLSIGEELVYTFDREGRLYSAFANGRNYRRGLDGRILEKWRGPSGRERRRRFMDTGELRRLVDDMRARLLAIDSAFTDGHLHPDGEWPPSARHRLGEWIDRLLRWDHAALAEHVRQFEAVYLPVSVMPPDQYMSLYLQIAEGCSWNRCDFCDLYRDRVHRVKREVELAEHLAGVRRLFGEGVWMRRSVFIGDANLLSISPGDLLAAMEQVRQAFPEDRFAALYGFADSPSVGWFGASDLQALGQRGLRRLYLGMETGSDGLRKMLRKPGTSAQMATAVRRLHEAGIGVGLIVLLGPGGRQWSARHVAETRQALATMGLREGDLLYFSPMVMVGDQSADPGRGIAGGALDAGEMQEQRRRIEEGLFESGSGPQSAVYHLTDFVY